MPPHNSCRQMGSDLLTGGSEKIPQCPCYSCSFRGGMDHWDPAVTDGFAKDRPVILFDHAGVASSSGETPDTIDAITEHAADFVHPSALRRWIFLGFCRWICCSDAHSSSPKHGKAHHAGSDRPARR